METAVNVRKSQEAGGVCVAELSGEIDVFASPMIKAALADLIRDGNVLLVVDLANVSYIDSTGLGALIATLKGARERGGSLAIVCTNPQVRRIFEITGLAKVFGMYDSADSASEELRNKFVSAT